MKRSLMMMLLAAVSLLAAVASGDAAEPTMAGRAVKLDSQGKMMPWYTPAENAYSEFLHPCWNFIKTRVPPSPGPAPRSDYHAYTGDAEAIAIVRKLIDYTLEHGTSPAAFAWPQFPYTTTRHGAPELMGFTPTFALHETHVDHAGDIGLTYYRLYRFTGDETYRTEAMRSELGSDWASRTAFRQRRRAEFHPSPFCQDLQVGERIVPG